MITLLRKIRRQLLSESKFTRYLMYALGEILLVVIGILIALQINNWRETVKARDFEKRILGDIVTAFDENYFVLEFGIQCNQRALNSGQVILDHFDQDLPYNDSLGVYFEKAVGFCTVALSNTGYESLKSYGLNIVTNDSIRNELGIFDNNWINTLDQRQEDYYSNTAIPILTDYFNQVAMRTPMIPHDYEELKKSKRYRTVVETSMAMRRDQIEWYNIWLESYRRIEGLINAELASDD